MSAMSTLSEMALTSGIGTGVAERLSSCGLAGQVAGVDKVNRDDGGENSERVLHEFGSLALF